MILLLSVSFNPTLLISLSNVISLLSKQVFIREIQYLGSILTILFCSKRACIAQA